MSIDDGKDTLSTQVSKKVLISLRLSSSSFLDSTVIDASTREELYVIRTQDMCTTISRYIPKLGPLVTTDIRWTKQTATKAKRKDVAGVLIQMKDDRWKPGDAFLSPPTLLR
jgi:hypothetical protein